VQECYEVGVEKWSHNFEKTHLGHQSLARSSTEKKKKTNSGSPEAEREFSKKKEKRKGKKKKREMLGVEKA